MKADAMCALLLSALSLAPVMACAAGGELFELLAERPYAISVECCDGGAPNLFPAPGRAKIKVCADERSCELRDLRGNSVLKINQEKHRPIVISLSPTLGGEQVDWSIHGPGEGRPAGPLDFRFEPPAQGGTTIRSSIDNRTVLELFVRSRQLAGESFVFVGYVGLNGAVRDLTGNRVIDRPARAGAAVDSFGAEPGSWWSQILSSIPAERWSWEKDRVENEPFIPQPPTPGRAQVYVYKQGTRFVAAAGHWKVIVRDSILADLRNWHADSFEFEPGRVLLEFGQGLDARQAALRLELTADTTTYVRLRTAGIGSLKAEVVDAETGRKDLVKGKFLRNSIEENRWRAEGIRLPVPGQSMTATLAVLVRIAPQLRRAPEEWEEQFAGRPMLASPSGRYLVDVEMFRVHYWRGFDD